MSEPMFRQKSLEQIQSPDELDDYIRVARPGTWLALTGVVVLLAGFFTWCAFGFGSIPLKDTRQPAETTLLYISSEDALRFIRQMEPGKILPAVRLKTAKGVNVAFQICLSPEKAVSADELRTGSILPGKSS